MQFRTTILAAGKTATGIEVPPEVVEGLGGGRRPAVVATVSGYTYRSSVAARGDRFLLSLSAEHRGNAGLAAGDEVDVSLELDTAPREVSVPTDLAAALDAVPAARGAFDALSYSNRLRHVLSVEGAKTAETRERRIGKAVAALAG